MKNEEKTNVMRLLESRKIPYTAHSYEADPSLTGEEIARILGEDPDRVFKTLVARGKSGQYYVFVIPVCRELDLKKAAKAANEKSIAMILQRELLPLTGYIHGGCSPVGMKKPFPTFLHASAENAEKICVSAGKVGFQIEVSPKDLQTLVRFRWADLTAE
ncbi:MAG: Cys-tRNA(Pro) deacylase [Clostridia bacterium]|nr:Cys-tRNA(Pro) deacylase [Clostridia bacterium]